MLKSKKEISLIENACLLADKTFDYILTKVSFGISEKELSLEIQRFIRKNGAKLSFRPILSFGKNSAEVHHKPNGTKLKKGDIIMLDLGAKLEDYCSDITRTIFFGKATPEQKKLYQTVLDAQTKAIEFLISHFSSPISSTERLKASKVDKIARDHIIKQGYPSIPHGLGHGIGKKVHQAPRLSPESKSILKTNMVFSVEPGIYIKDFGGIRIEDLVVLEEKNVRILSRANREIIEL